MTAYSIGTHCNDSKRGCKESKVVKTIREKILREGEHMDNRNMTKGEMALAQNKMNRMLNRAPARVAVIESRTHSAILSYLVKKGCTSRTFALDCGVDKVTSWEPDGFIIIGNPKEGDIQEYLNIHHQLVSYMKDTGLPVLGVGMGHQLLALSEGLQVTVKRRNRQENIPVKNRLTGKLEVKAVKGDTVLRLTLRDQRKVEVTHTNINNQNAEGLQYKHFPGFSVQYMPTSSDYLFNHFIDLVQMRVFKQSRGWNRVGTL